MLPRGDHGLTLTELTVVMVLATLVMTGIVTFYINSQGVWLDGSSQAVAQRDATFLLERVAEEAHKSTHAQVVHVASDTLHQTLIFQDPASDERCRFVWNPEDGLVHFYVGPTQDERGPVMVSRVERFQVDTNDTLVFLRDIRLSSTTGRSVEMTSSVALYNR